MNKARTISYTKAAVRQIARCVALAIFLSAGAALAQSPAPTGSDSLLKSFFKMTGYATDVPPAKDFVEKSRPEAGKTDYVPLYERPADRPVKVLKPAEVEAKKAELDKLREQHDKLSGRKPVAPPVAAIPPAKKRGARKPAA